jgi:hypothetical protein
MVSVSIMALSGYWLLTTERIAMENRWLSVTVNIVMIG